MKLVTYRLSGAEHVGALTADGKGVLPLPAADMNTLIETMTLADLRSAALPTFALPPRRQSGAVRSRCQMWSCWLPSPAPGRMWSAWA